jgi:hypothetical protein
VKWCGVQIAFKNKPAESTENPVTSERNRPLNVFGMPLVDSNCNGCHILHRSFQGRNLIQWNNAWNGVNADDADNMPHEIEQNKLEPQKSAAFFDKTCIEEGIFALAVKGESSLFSLIDSGPDAESFNLTRFNRVFDKMFSIFAGCRDCNQKMTINRFARLLFDMVYAADTYIKKKGPETAAGGGAGVGESADEIPGDGKSFKGSFDDEGRIYYLMLSGLIAAGDIESDSGHYTIKGDSNQTRKRSWRFDVVAVWCQLQVLFCLWKWSSTHASFGHHVNYIYLGVADFYMAFLMYAMHEGSMSRHSGYKSLEFETFHYFYSSMYPCFVRNNVDGRSLGTCPHNLSLLVLDPNNGGIDILKTKWAWPVDRARNTSANLDEVRKQVRDLRTAIVCFWRDKFSHLSKAIHRQASVASRNEEMGPPFGRFFTNYNKCLEIVGHSALMQGTLTLQKSVTLMPSRQLYWLHFKYITFLSINESCKQCETYYQSLRIPCERAAYQQTWQRWVNTFYAKLEALGIIPPPPPRPAGGDLGAQHGALLLHPPSERRCLPSPPSRAPFPPLRSADFAGLHPCDDDDDDVGPAAVVGDLLRLLDELRRVRRR